jgi:seryl-tRNA synthetase
MTLYEIDQAIQAALEGAIDAESGEIIDEELLAAYNQLQMDRDQKIENIGCYIKNLEADAKAIKEEAKNLTARAKAAENRAEHLRDYLQFCLAGETFKSPRLAVSFRRSTKVEVDQNRLFEIPDDYLRYKEPEVDKKRVSEALKAGEAIPGCTLVESTSMIIK